MAAQVPTVVFAAPNRVEIRTMELPEVGPRDVRIRTIFSGVSQGTERWLLTDRHRWKEGVPQYPHHPGYQAAGVVEEVGAEVAEHGVQLTGVEPGDLVVVIGQGMIGQMSAQAARCRGARVIAADVIPARVEAASAHSADRAVHASREDLAEVVHEECPDGADVVIDTTGIGGMLETCVELVRREGRICLQGYYPDPIRVEFHPTHLKRATVTFPCWVDREHDAELAADLASGGVVIEPLITHRIPYTDAVAAFDLVVHHPERSLGMVLVWSEE